MRKLILSAVAASLLTPAGAGAETAADVIRKVQTKEQRRMSGVDAYFVRESTLVDYIPDINLYFFAVKGKDGKKVGYRQVNPGELQVAALEAAGATITAGGETYEGGVEIAAASILTVLAMGIAAEKTGFAIDRANPDEPYKDPKVQSGEKPVPIEYSLVIGGRALTEMAKDAAWSLNDSLVEQADVPTDAAKNLAKFGSIAEGLEGEIYGRDYYYLYKDDLDIKQHSEEDKAEYIIQSMALAIDKEDYFVRGMRFDGVAKKKKKSEPFFIQRLDRDFRPVKNALGNDTSLIIPHVTDMILGLPNLSEKDRKELAKARKELAEARREWDQNSGDLSALPPAQREQITAMFNDAIDRAERQIRLLEGKLQMSITKKVVEARGGTVEEFMTWLEEHMKQDGMATAAGSVDSAMEAATEAAQNN